MEQLGARPTTGSFNALLDACAESGRADRAIEVLGLMRRVGVRPNGGTYAALKRMSLACRHSCTCWLQAAFGDWT